RVTARSLGRRARLGPGRPSPPLYPAHEVAPWFSVYLIHSRGLATWGKMWHAKDRFRRHRLGFGVGGTRHADDAGAWVLLRRPGPPQERPLHHHAQLLHPVPDQRPVGALGL